MSLAELAQAFHEAVGAGLDRTMVSSDLDQYYAQLINGVDLKFN